MNLTRRTALKMLSAGAITVVAGNVPLLGAQGARTRRTLTGMSLSDPDLSAYRDFVGIMLANDQSQPLSWLGFANQHGSLTDGYRFCPHGDWYFLPWHRAYVLMYENAVRKLTGHDGFAMPYWNWTEMRTLPEAFANPTYNGKANPLYVPNRNSFTLPDSIVGQTDVIDGIYQETDYEAFGTSRNPDQQNLDPSWVPQGGGYQGTLESTPHNLVHNTIGAYMPTAASPRDPLFFMHHGNIDRIWASWNAMGRQNSADPLWLNMPFKDNYIDPTGAAYSATVSELQDINTLGYTYDFLPQADHVAEAAPVHTQLLAALHAKAGTEIPNVEKFGGTNTAAATVSAPLTQKWALSETKLKAIASAKPPKVYALIRDITMGPGVKAVRVFINRTNLTMDVPDTDPHYVQTFSFLDHGAGAGTAGTHAMGAAHKRLPSVLINLTPALKKLYGYRRLSAGEITVQLIPVPAPGVALEIVGKVVPASVEIVVL